jgi:hypothetical protein
LLEEAVVGDIQLEEQEELVVVDLVHHRLVLVW